MVSSGPAFVEPLFEPQSDGGRGGSVQAGHTSGPIDARASQTSSQDLDDITHHVKATLVEIDTVVLETSDKASVDAGGSKFPLSKVLEFDDGEGSQ